MATGGKCTGIVGYNVQIAVDAEHHFIVAHEVTNLGTDRAQLASMGRKARDAIECEEVTVLADRGYYCVDGMQSMARSMNVPAVPAPERRSRRSAFGFGRTLFGRPRLSPSNDRFHPSLRTIGKLSRTRQPALFGR